MRFYEDLHDEIKERREESYNKYLVAMGTFEKNKKYFLMAGSICDNKKVIKKELIVTYLGYVKGELMDKDEKSLIEKEELTDENEKSLITVKKKNSKLEFVFSEEPKDSGKLEFTNPKYLNKLSFKIPKEIASHAGFLFGRLFYYVREREIDPYPLFKADILPNLNLLDYQIGIKEGINYQIDAEKQRII